MPTQEFKSTKSHSTFTVTGEAYAKAKVQKEITRIRQGGSTWDEAVWTAKMLASTY